MRTREEIMGDILTIKNAINQNQRNYESGEYSEKTYLKNRKMFLKTIKELEKEARKL